MSRSLRKTLRRAEFLLTADQHFSDVMTLCALSRIEDSGFSSMDGEQCGTWLGPEMIDAYSELHAAGHAHSIEVYDLDGRMAGGLYGVTIGGAFFGESMFSLAPNTSKIAFAGLLHILHRNGFGLIDCQMETPLLNSFGAINVNRLDFEKMLAQTTSMTIAANIWTLPASCGGLL
jgi:leucyl/phenylalanyl-tRNA--protein transferase